jgi:uncharacterized protein
LETQARLIVDIARLDEEGDHYKGELPAEVFDLGESEVFSPAAGLTYDLFIQALGTELLVRGKLSLSLNCICVRCGADFQWVATDDAFVISIEISDTTDFLDLTEELREAIILALPGYPVCSKACKGLCMTCGKNLNKENCTCHEAGQDTRWGALNGLG